MATHSFPVPTHLISICKWFSARKTLLTRPQTQDNTFICLLDLLYEAAFANTKLERQRWPEMPLILGRSGTQYVAMVTKLLSLNCGAHLKESYCKESNISVWRHHLINLHILKTWISLEQKEIFENSKEQFFLMQATCLCFKQASIEKMQFRHSGTSKS